MKADDLIKLLRDAGVDIEDMRLTSGARVLVIYLDPEDDITDVEVKEDKQ